MSTRTAGVEANVTRESTGVGLYSSRRSKGDSNLGRRQSHAINAGTPENPGNSTAHHCSQSACIANTMGWCTEAERPHAAVKRKAPSIHNAQTIPRHRMIFHPKEWYEFVPIICDGWAAYSIVGADGHRQILSFRLPGDIVSTAWLGDGMSERMVEAITQVTYRKFARTDFMTMLFDVSGLPEKLMKVLSNELAHAERVAYTIGRRRADERIARLIVGLSERLAKHGMMQGQTMEFPLRQRDIADATGLTHDHVSKVLGNFQRANMIKISDQSLTIIDQPELRSRAMRPSY